MSQQVFFFSRFSHNYVPSWCFKNILSSIPHYFYKIVLDLFYLDLDICSDMRCHILPFPTFGDCGFNILIWRFYFFVPLTLTFLTLTLLPLEQIWLMVSENSSTFEFRRTDSRTDFLSYAIAIFSETIRLIQSYSHQIWHDGSSWIELPQH